MNQTVAAQAPGRPGIPARWTSSDKAGVGTALSPLSRVWFTLSHGILNEVYYPRVDQACIRDLGLLVTDGVGFFSEEKRDAHHRVFRDEDGVPAFRLVNTCVHGRYVIEKRIVSDPAREVVLQSIALKATGDQPLRLFALLAPHLVNGGAHNTAWVGDYKGVRMLFAEGSGTALALAASVPWLACSAGFVGVSDGWQDISRNFALTTLYGRAEDGNVALTGEFDLAAAAGHPVTLALGFGRTWSEAALRVRSSLFEGFEPALAATASGWRAWQRGLLPLDPPPDPDPAAADRHNFYRVSTAVLRAHESPSFPGGFIASLSIPWGASKGDDDLGGYHLVWPRDLVESAGGLLACGAHTDARRVLDYLRNIQEPDGSWPQNTWLDGLPYWPGLQLDECAFPILLVELAQRQGALPDGVAPYADMVRRAAGFVARNGPATSQDRWEEDAGFSPFTLAVEIAGLLAAADMAPSAEFAALLRDTADAWNDRIEEWTFATDSRLAREAGADGTYVRIAPLEGVQGMVAVRNRPDGENAIRAAELVSPDALALVRFGLRAATDPRILATVRVIDHALKVDLPQGPCWRRYNGDGYGEHADGRPFDGTGIGRPWPLLTGERAHYALAAGDTAGARALLATLEGLTSRGGLIPEQVWDTDDIPSLELLRGHPSGSAMPLVWAHSEHIKLRRSLRDGAVFDTPPQTVQRYLVDRVAPRCAVWRPGLASPLPAGRALRIDLDRPSVVVWSADGWATRTETATRDTGIGLHVADLPAAALAPGTVVAFTWRDAADGRWLGSDHSVTVGG